MSTTYTDAAAKLGLTPQGLRELCNDSGIRCWAESGRPFSGDQMARLTAEIRSDRADIARIEGHIATAKVNRENMRLRNQLELCMTKRLAGLLIVAAMFVGVVIGMAVSA